MILKVRMFITTSSFIYRTIDNRINKHLNRIYQIKDTFPNKFIHKVSLNFFKSKNKYPFESATKYLKYINKMLFSPEKKLSDVKRFKSKELIRSL